MNEISITPEITTAIVGDLGQSSLFKGLSSDELEKIAGNASMCQYDPGEIVMDAGTGSDGFYLVVGGEVIIKSQHPKRDEWVELTRIVPYETVGELGLILNEPRSARVEAGEDAVLLRFGADFFREMFHTLPNFGLVTCRVLAKRLQAGSGGIPMPPAGDTTEAPARETLKLLSIDFMQRHRVVPLKNEGNLVYIGCVDAPNPQMINAVRESLAGMALRPVSIDNARFNALLQLASTSSAVEQAEPIMEPEFSSPELDVLLRRMVAEGASDLHLTARHVPRVRIDGEVSEMGDASLLDSDSIMALLEPIMPERNLEQFRADNDTDLAYAIKGVARFRVNVFRDNHGVGAVFRQIPDKILTMEQLGLPPVVRNLCDYPKGLILVTGPTGSGKSTTLAAMIDHINKTRTSHVITLEDPIEFVHESQGCLVNQREVGPHTTSFSRALRAALREDPDIVLVGEMRDLETVALALETANTGHLVFGTLHTNTAVSTISRVIDMFPAGQQNQVRTVLADTLKGVVAQTLCRRKGGGRVAALEILVSDLGVAALIRDGKTHQIISAMQTGKVRGNRLLNEELKRLVEEEIVSEEEALAKAVDKPDLMSKLGIKPEGEEDEEEEPRKKRR